MRIHSLCLLLHCPQGGELTSPWTVLCGVCTAASPSLTSPSSRRAPEPPFCLPAHSPFTPLRLALHWLRGGHPDKVHAHHVCTHGRLGKLRPGAWEGLALVWWERNPAFSAVDTCSLTSLACHTYTLIHMGRPSPTPTARNPPALPNGNIY